MTVVNVASLSVGLWCLAACFPACADEPLPYNAGEALLNQYHCQACHRPYDAGPGPSLHAIAEKYASDPHARGDLAQSVLNGSTGSWGPVPMAAVAVPETDLSRLIDWILSLR
jgi:cytochrome c